MGKYACLAYVGVSEEGASRGSKPFLTEFPAPFSNPRISSESERDTECRARERNDAAPSPFPKPRINPTNSEKAASPPSTSFHKVTHYRISCLENTEKDIHSREREARHGGLRLTADSGYVPDRVPQGSTSPGVPR